MDYVLYRLVNGLSGRSDLADELLRLLASNLPALVIALVALVFLWPWDRHQVERRTAAVMATAASGLALLANQPITHAVDRVRPYVAHPAQAHLLIPASHDPAFPSDHATGAFAIATAVWCYDRRLGALFFALATLLAVSRVYVGTHYPGDVVGGAAIGIVVAVLLRWSPIRRTIIEPFAARCSDIWNVIVRRLSTFRPRANHP